MSISTPSGEGRGRLGEALRELSFLKARQDVELSSVVALLFFHKLAENIDYQEIEILSNVAARATERASEPSLLLCAQFHLYAGIHATSNERRCEQFKASRSLIRKVKFSVRSCA
jgi:tetratricopeptide repeat protein 21B